MLDIFDHLRHFVQEKGVLYLLPAGDVIRRRLEHAHLKIQRCTNLSGINTSSKKRLGCGITMPTYTGSCYCRNIEYELKLASPDDARTSLCHCQNCKKAFGTNYGLTAKVSKDAFHLTKGQPKEHAADNGSGMVIHREFCDTCGSFILEYGDAVKDSFRYIVVGSLDDPEALPPKGEFFCKSRASWMPEIPNVFHKQEIKQ